jgi:hypothetical protein
MATKTKKTTTKETTTKGTKSATLAAKKPRINRWKITPEIEAAATAAVDAADPATASVTPTKPKPKKAPAEKGAGKMSAIDAAAAVLKVAGTAMNAKELIEAMSAQGFWSSPGGKTPHATLYSAILREINLKGPEARFQKTERGKFALAETVSPPADLPAKSKGKKKTTTPPADGSPGPNSVAELFRI